MSSGVLNVEGMELDNCYFAESTDEEGQPVGPRHLYALPAFTLNLLLDDAIEYDNRDKYMVIVSYVPNPDTTAVVLNSVIEQFTGPIPQWVIDLEAENQANTESGS